MIGSGTDGTVPGMSLSEHACSALGSMTLMLRAYGMPTRAIWLSSRIPTWDARKHAGSLRGSYACQVLRVPINASKKERASHPTGTSRVLAQSERRGSESASAVASVIASVIASVVASVVASAVASGHRFGRRLWSSRVREQLERIVDHDVGASGLKGVARVVPPCHRSCGATRFASCDDVARRVADVHGA